MDVTSDFAYRSFFKILEEDYPDLINRIYPRKFQHGDGWFSPKHLATIAFNAMMAANQDFIFNGKPDKVLPQVYYTLGGLIRDGVPTYFVSSELMTAIASTRFPSDMTLKDLRWPFDSALFVMPRGIKTPDDGDLLYLCISRTEPNTPCQILPRKERNALVTSQPFITTFAYVYGGQSYAWGHFLNNDPLDIGNQDPVFDTTNIDADINGLKIDWRKMTDSELVFNRHMITLTLQLLMLMTARKEFVEPMVMTHQGKMVAGTKKPDLWKPNFLGKKYTIRREWQGGTHQSPRAHPRGALEELSHRRRAAMEGSSISLD